MKINIKEWPEFDNHPNAFSVEGFTIDGKEVPIGVKLSMDQYNLARSCLASYAKLVELLEQVLSDNAFDQDIHQSTLREYLTKLAEFKLNLSERAKR